VSDICTKQSTHLTSWPARRRASRHTVSLPVRNTGLSVVVLSTTNAIYPRPKSFCTQTSLPRQCSVHHVSYRANHPIMRPLGRSDSRVRRGATGVPRHRHDPERQQRSRSAERERETEAGTRDDKGFPALYRLHKNQGCRSERGKQNAAPATLSPNNREDLTRLGPLRSRPRFPQTEERTTVVSAPASTQAWRSHQRRRISTGDCQRAD